MLPSPVFPADAVYIVNIIHSIEKIKNGSAKDAVILRQVLVAADTFQNFGFTNDIAVVFPIFQAVYICVYFHKTPTSSFIRLLFPLLRGRGIVVRA